MRRKQDTAPTSEESTLTLADTTTAVEDTSAEGTAPTMPEYVAHIKQLTANATPPIAPPAAVRIEPVLSGGGPLTVEVLNRAKVWAVWSGPLKQFIGTDGAPATAANLTTFAEASEAMSWMVGDSYPPHYSIALSLDASACICVSLLGAWDEARGCIKEGADMWAATLDSYTEKCWSDLGETALRVICRGKLPHPCNPPRAVRIQADGFCTLTTQRISSRPAWQGDSGGTIRDCTEALAELLVPKGPQYVSI